MTDRYLGMTYDELFDELLRRLDAVIDAGCVDSDFHEWTFDVDCDTPATMHRTPAVRLAMRIMSTIWVAQDAGLTQAELIDDLRRERDAVMPGIGTR